MSTRCDTCLREPRCRAFVAKVRRLRYGGWVAQPLMTELHLSGDPRAAECQGYILDPLLAAARRAYEEG